MGGRREREREREMHVHRQILITTNYMKGSEFQWDNLTIPQNNDYHFMKGNIHVKVCHYLLVIRIGVGRCVGRAPWHYAS